MSRLFINIYKTMIGNNYDWIWYLSALPTYHKCLDLFKMSTCRDFSKSFEKTKKHCDAIWCNCIISCQQITFEHAYCPDLNEHTLGQLRCDLTRLYHFLSTRSKNLLSWDFPNLNECFVNEAFKLVFQVQFQCANEAGSTYSNWMF